MPIPSFTGLQTALKGLEAAQAELDTTGQNISNESTPGYSRQKVVTTDCDSLTLPAVSSTTGTGAQLGTGVSISNITRVRNQFLDVQYRTQNSVSTGSRRRTTSSTRCRPRSASPTAPACPRP